MHRTVWLFVLLFAVALVPAMADVSITWSLGNASVTSIGNDGSSGPTYDALTLTGLSGALSFPPGVQTVAVNSAEFDAGNNCLGAGDQCPNSSGTVAQDITVDGITQTLAFQLLYSDAVTQSEDTMTLVGGSPVIFNLGGGDILTVTPLGYAFDPNYGGAQIEPLNAQFTLTSSSVPEPGAVSLLFTMLAGVGGLAGVLRKKLT